MNEPTGPTDHLDTVEYWKELYFLAIAEGQSLLNQLRECQDGILSSGDSIKIPSGEHHYE
jgi:hypothetical protein